MMVFTSSKTSFGETSFLPIFKYANTCLRNYHFNIDHKFINISKFVINVNNKNSCLDTSRFLKKKLSMNNK